MTSSAIAKTLLGFAEGSSLGPSRARRAAASASESPVTVRWFNDCSNLDNVVRQRSVVGRPIGPRRPTRPPSAGPRILFGLLDQSRAHRIHLNISPNAPEFVIATN